MPLASKIAAHHTFQIAQRYERLFTIAQAAIAFGKTVPSGLRCQLLPLLLLQGLFIFVQL